MAAWNARARDIPHKDQQPVMAAAGGDIVSSITQASQIVPNEQINPIRSKANTTGELPKF
jgi:hypothetical protein